ncbi:MAG: DHA2 family efflux MFS transporter permease subunit [Pseudomonadota bacterium]
MPQLAPNKWLVTITVMTGTIMAALDTSIVNVALPFMRGNLGASVEEITWVTTGYILSNVIVMPIIGLLSDLFGRQRFYMLSVVFFTLASALCGLAWDLPSMVFFRVLQGVGGGALIPVSQAVLRETFPPEEQGMAMGIYGLGVVMGPAFGPTLGGWLTDNFSWPWIFYINVPVGALNLFLVQRYMKDPPYMARQKGKIDLLGLFLLTVGLGSLQLMLEKGHREDWLESDLIRVLVALTISGMALFIWRELKIERPAVNLRLLKNITFAAGTFLGSCLGVALFASLFLVPMLLQQLLGYTALDSGLVLMPRSLAMALSMPLAGRLYNRLGPRLLIAGGMLISAYSFWDFGRLSLQVGFWDLLVPQVWQGLGFGMIFVALSTVSLSTISRPQLTAASGLYNVVRQVAGSVGTAWAATALTANTIAYRSELTQHLTPYGTVARDWLAGVGGALISRGAQMAQASAQALRLLEGQLERQAMMLAFNRVFFMFLLMFVICMPLALLLRQPKNQAPEVSTLAE